MSNSSQESKMVVRASSGGASAGKYHISEECPNLTNCPNPQWKRRETLFDDTELCEICRKHFDVPDWVENYGSV